MSKTKQLEEWLDERWMIATMTERPQDLCFYNGAVQALEMIGYDWERDEEGNHKLYK